jgi:hypothetical protein
MAQSCCINVQNTSLAARGISRFFSAEHVTSEMF